MGYGLFDLYSRGNGGGSEWTVMKYVGVIFLILLAPVTSVAGDQIVPKFHVTVEGDASKPILVGMTNLPEGTKLLITISRSESGYRAQDNPVVLKDGTFKTVRFSNRGNPLTSGEHIVEVLMPLPSVQPRNVQAIIGRSGENLSGDLVNKDSIGVTVEYHTSFTVAGPKSKSKDDAAWSETVQKKLEWIRQSCRGSFGFSGADFQQCYDEAVVSFVASQRGSSASSIVKTEKHQNEKVTKPAPPKPKDGHLSRITVRAKSTSWIQIRDEAQDQLLFTRLLRAGDEYQMPNRNGLSLMTGNAGALEVLVDGEVVPSIGEEGEVRRSVAMDPDRLKSGTATND